ncbi:hypothetical protein E2C01_012137 [Portunus trituberculatus]|uniref:Uncharacterized protein n=1 Tax=Portunus trituberculatus TaxID=210409 RepID=A0A5B7DDT5_PORTR|nr:hypothetical protein [Portunus trituberculatus]
MQAVHAEQLEDKDTRQDLAVDHFVDSFIITPSESLDEECSAGGHFTLDAMLGETYHAHDLKLCSLQSPQCISNVFASDAKLWDTHLPHCLQAGYFYDHSLDDACPLGLPPLCPHLQPPTYCCPLPHSDPSDPTPQLEELSGCLRLADRLAFGVKLPLAKSTCLCSISLFQSTGIHSIPHIRQQQEWASTPPITSVGLPQNLRGATDGEAGGR